MSKDKKIFVCRECGWESPRWQGKCRCGAWNSMEEALPLTNNPVSLKPKEPVPINAPRAAGSTTRLSTGDPELDRVLGGGLVKGSFTLLSGDPGVGKSTLLLQAANHISQSTGPVLYISGEESEEQLQLRARRLQAACSRLLVLTETSFEQVEAVISRVKPVMVVLDSIQTMHSGQASSPPGSVVQVRECALKAMGIAKTMDIMVWVTAHVTKQGAIAGPRLLDHMVDTVLYLEGERNFGFRMLRPLKNRFGATNELGVYEMVEKGLEPIENPSLYLLSEKSRGIPGAVVVASVDNSRPLLVELQALVVKNDSGVPPRRTAVGISRERLNLIVAILQKRAGVAIGWHDIYASLVGGVEIEETSIDLGLAVALYSSLEDKGADPGTVILGELDLAGRVRPVHNIERLVREAEKLGFSRCLIPGRNLDKARAAAGKIQLVPVDTLRSALKNFQFIVEKP